MILNKSSAEIMYMRGGKGGEVIPHLGLINGKVKKKWHLCGRSWALLLAFLKDTLNILRNSGNGSLP